MEENKNNLEFWNKYRAVPKNAVKSFDNGKFSGTDINTMWRLKSLTETFGMCGFGWYFTIKDKWTETANNGDMFAFAEIELFVKQNNEWSKPISGTGGNKLARVTKDRKLSTSDEAFKMAVTDAIGVACRSLGMGADIYWENDKTKYTEQNDTTKFQSTKYTLPANVTYEERTPITAEQIAKFKELDVIVKNVLKRFNVERVEDLDTKQAEFVISAKEKMIASGQQNG